MMISEEEGGRGNISISHVQQNRKFTTELGRAGGSCSDVCANRRRGGGSFLPGSLRCGRRIRTLSVAPEHLGK